MAWRICVGLMTQSNFEPGLKSECYDFHSSNLPCFSLLLLLLLSRISRVQLCATPQMAAHQVPLSLGFSRQEHWSGLPFPSPVRESEVAQSCLTQRPHGLQPTRLLHPWDFPGKSTGVGCPYCLLSIASVVLYLAT